MVQLASYKRHSLVEHAPDEARDFGRHAPLDLKLRHLSVTRRMKEKVSIKRAK